MSILKNIIDKKQSGKIKVEDKKVYHSELLGEDIEIVKKPLSEFLDILNSAEAENEIMGLNYLIHAFCPMFQDPDGVKEAMEFYGVATPRELPEHVFESNMTEMARIAELISSFYDVEGVGEDIKN